MKLLRKKLVFPRVDFYPFSLTQLNNAYFKSALSLSLFEINLVYEIYLSNYPARVTSHYYYGYHAAFLSIDEINNWLSRYLDTKMLDARGDVGCQRGARIGAISQWLIRA